MPTTAADLARACAGSFVQPEKLAAVLVAIQGGDNTNIAMKVKRAIGSGSGVWVDAFANKVAALVLGGQLAQLQEQCAPLVGGGTAVNVGTIMQLCENLATGA